MPDYFIQAFLLSAHLPHLAAAHLHGRWFTAASLTLYLCWTTTPGNFVLFQPCFEMQTKGTDLSRAFKSITLRQGQTIGFLGLVLRRWEHWCQSHLQSTEGWGRNTTGVRSPWGREAFLCCCLAQLWFYVVIACKWGTLKDKAGLSSKCWQWMLVTEKALYPLIQLHFKTLALGHVCCS